MVDTLVIKALTSITTPLPGNPKIPDIESNKIFLLQASDLAYADGASITSMVASGTANAVIRTFNTKVAANYPVMSTTLGPLGGKCIEFNGTNQISTGDLVTPITQPLTYAVVYRLDVTPTATNGRIIGGRSAPYLQNFYAGTSLGAYIFNAGNGVNIATSLPLSTWLVSVYVFNGTLSKGILGGQAWSGNASTNGLQGLSLGSNATATGDLLNGAIAHIQIHDRAFTDNELTILYNNIKSQYGIA